MHATPKPAQERSGRRFGFPRRAARAPATHVPPPRRPTVLLVDDVEAIRALLSIALEPEFTVVGEAADGEEAVAQTRVLQPDLVVLDLNMPRHDGLEALAAIREACARTRVVVLSGLDPQLIEDKARALGAVGFVDKSEPLAALPAVLRDALAS